MCSGERVSRDECNILCLAPCSPGPGSKGCTVRGQTSTGARLAARGPKSWGGRAHPGELWPGGPGQARVESRAGVTRPHASQCRGGARLARTTALAPLSQGNVSRKTTPPPGRVGERSARRRGGFPGPRPAHRTRCEGGPQRNSGAGQGRSRPGPRAGRLRVGRDCGRLGPT
jgi:hypothetical protein